MDEYFFSILVPNINFSGYLLECLDSICYQNTENLFSYEIIVCDQSDDLIYNAIKQKIAERYSDKRINLFHSDIKSSYKARIKLLSCSKGKYILFVDSDDMLFPNALLRLYNLICKSGFCDIYQFELFSGKHFTDYISHSKDCFKYCNNYLNYFLSKTGTYSICIKCLKNKTLNLIDEDIFISDDALLSLPFAIECKTAVITNMVLYFYRQNLSSGTHQKNEKMIDDLCIFLSHSYKYCLEKKEIGMWIFSFVWTYLNVYFSLLRKLNISKIAKDVLSKIDSISFVVFPISLKFAFRCARKNKVRKFKFFFFIVRLYVKLFSTKAIKITVWSINNYLFLFLYLIDTINKKTIKTTIQVKNKNAEVIIDLVINFSPEINDMIGAYAKNRELINNEILATSQ